MEPLTLVTAFIGNINSRNDRSIEKYIEYGKHLLKTPIPKVFFVDIETYEVYFEKDLVCYPSTHFVPIPKESLYLYRYRDQIEYSVATDNTKKDTLEYMFIQCNKTEWMVQAIDLNLYKSKQFVWIDFGIFHLFRDKHISETDPHYESATEKIVEAFHENILAMRYQKYDKIRIAACGDPNSVFQGDIYSQIVWMFAGGVFGGSASALILFAAFAKQLCYETVVEKNRLMWEVNIWYMVYQKHPELFDLYKSGHDHRIINNY